MLIFFSGRGAVLLQMEGSWMQSLIIIIIVIITIIIIIIVIIIIIINIISTRETGKLFSESYKNAAVMFAR